MEVQTKGNGTALASMKTEVIRKRFHMESRMRENCTLRLCYATASQAGSMRVNRRKRPNDLGLMGPKEDFEWSYM